MTCTRKGLVLKPLTFAVFPQDFILIQAACVALDHFITSCTDLSSLINYTHLNTFPSNSHFNHLNANLNLAMHML